MEIFIIPNVLTFPAAIFFWTPIVLGKLAERRIWGKKGVFAFDARTDPSLQAIMWCSRISRASALLLSFIAFATMPYPSFQLGVFLIVFGQALRLAGIYMLGVSFTPNVTQPSSLKTDGIYAYVRHPGYAGGYLLNLGIGLALGNAIGLAILAILNGAALVWRVRVEERVLLEAYGDQYIDYASRVRRFVPFVF